MLLRLFPLLLLARAASPQTPTIRVTTRLVDVSVIARDRNGPVASLTADDFRVFDNGEERKIAFFSMTSVRPAASPPAPLVPNVFTTRPDRRTDAAGRLTVILLDSLNTTFENQVRARQQVMKYLAAIQPRDRMAICAMGTSIRVVHDFTNKAQELAQTLDRYWGSLELIPASKAGAAGAEGSPAGAAAFNAGADAQTEAMLAAWRGHVTTDLMKELANQLARTPGRKNLIWLSTGFPIEMTIPAPPTRQENVTPGELSGTARALARADIAIYPVDTAGLVAGTGGRAIAAVAASERNRHYPLDLLAQLTGGRAFYDRNDLEQAIREAVGDSEVTYTLGFYPGPGGQDGAYHRLQIDVLREGVDLRYRPGYQAADPFIPTAEPDGREEIHDALWSPVDATGISLTARLEKPNPAKPRSLRMTIAIPVGDIALEELEGGWLGTLDLVVGQRSPDGRDLATLGEEVKVNPNRQRYETLRKEGLLLRREIELRPGASKVRIVVFDRGSGRLGSLEIPARP